ncbi:MAG: hypothetical protein NWF06_07795 [Candidatus Bathyarchaeota archaeon]|nr:hypothetical protein [Candidatus Bathyarchaeum sp.]
MATLRKTGWGSIIWVLLGFLMFLTAFFAQNVVTMTFGLALTFGSLSLCLTSHLKTDNTIKKALEIVFLVAAFTVFGYGYIVTQSLILGLMMIFIVVMTLFAFTATYLLPKIRNKPKK